MNNENYIEELIAKVLTGEATEADMSELNSWRSESETNERYFISLQKIFNESDKIELSDEYDTDSAWENVRSEIRKARFVEGSSNNTGLNLSWIRMAAAIILLAGLTYTAYNIFKEKPETVLSDNIISGSDSEEHILPDSSEVSLNRNSEIFYSYNNDERKVKLKGEAFFDLKSDPRPFILETGDLTIRDIGTAFNVKSFGDGDSVRVLVTDGEVLLTSTGGKTLSVLKGQQAMYYRMRDEIISETISDTNALAYKTKVFVFENAGLKIVLLKLEEVYGESIKMSGSLNNCRITATFKNEELESILEIITETLNLELVKTETGYDIKGDGCE